MFLGDRKDDIEATNDQLNTKNTLEQVFELADMVIMQRVNGMCGHMYVNYTMWYTPVQLFLYKL